MLTLPRVDAIGQDATSLQYGSTMQIRIVRHDGEPVVLFLKGELDITSMDSFERALAQVRPEISSGLTIDLLECTFVSVQGYEAMARCSRQTRCRSAIHDRPREAGLDTFRLRGCGAGNDPPAHFPLSALPTTDGRLCGPGKKATGSGGPREVERAWRGRAVDLGPEPEPEPEPDR